MPWLIGSAPSHHHHRTGFYVEREADLANALRACVMALGAEADVQPLVMAALRAGWGLTEIHRMIAVLRGQP
ncbi:hypothetical protein [Phyllobacterium chamaecytisi]|uniref:hypothetical protein n=1 Tax=Phyllobacterium chamaecytisi TaxID=2876082 RepID=UPI001CCCA9F6|nr:hypothetical protein [Phyllobacterium sp. KW56]MBZ9605711.1 hypothetical protein [Phyllobacterium sp. KW56]